MIDVYIGAPGQGKTFTAVHRAIQELRKGRQVLSNFPIKDPSTNMSTEIWKKEYASQAHIRNALIVIDEAWRDYNSKDWKDISVEEHSFFAECRHWNNDIILIAQSSARIATIAKEIANIVIIKKKSLFNFFILGFKKEYYETLEDVSRKNMSKEPLYYKHEWVFFNKNTARAYDTHYNARQDMKQFKGDLWYPNEKVSVYQKFKNFRKNLNIFDGKIEMVIQGGLCISQNLMKKGLRWLWYNFTPSRRLLKKIPFLIRDFLSLPLIRQLNEWRLS